MDAHGGSHSRGTTARRAIWTRAVSRASLAWRPALEARAIAASPCKTAQPAYIASARPSVAAPLASNENGGYSSTSDA
jgi:hypothetical protein